jgi:hypothetical protein
MQVLALRLKVNKASPIMALHIEGKQNAISDVPLRSFGSTPAWHRESDLKFLTLFSSLFTLPYQNSWTGFHLNSKVVMHVISMLRTRHSNLEEWHRLPKTGTHAGIIGLPMSNLWNGPISTEYPVWTSVLMSHGICGKG